jgi:hypothetical protein
MSGQYYNRAIASMIFLLIFTFPVGVESYDNEITHPQLTRRSSLLSSLNNYLINNLSIEEGLDKILKNDFTWESRSILQWLQKGSTDEDSPMCRASNHFHNPLRAWNKSGMSDQPAFVNLRCILWIPWYSNVTWATGYLSPSPDGQKAAFNSNPYYAPNTWDNSRHYYYNALTSTSTENREYFLAEAFKALGQVMHLLQDVSVPAHARNDFTSHLNYSGYFSLNPINWIGNRYEHYVKNNPGLVAAATPEFSSFTNPRLTDFWDTNLYTGTNPSTDRSIGLAEFANGNYLSDYTIPNNNPTPEHSFPHPALSSANMQICEDLKPNSLKKRKYISRISKGDCPPVTEARAADHFATPSLLNKEYLVTNGNISLLRLWLDENVHNTYAKDILPRAVGYSAGLLDYFFRGQLHIEVLAPSVDQIHVSDIYGSYFANRDDLGTDINTVAVLLRNNSKLYDGTSEPVGPGTLTLTIGYTDTSSGSVVYQTAGTVSVTGIIPAVGSNSPPLNILFPLAQPIRAQNVKDLTYYFAFTGKLGQEEGAVLGRVVKAPVLYSVSPDQGTEGTPVILTGDNLPDPADQPNTKGVCFNADSTKPYSIELISRTETEITVKVPNTAALEKPGYGGLRVKNVLERLEGEETLEEIIYSNPVSFFPIAEGEIVNYGKFLIDAHVEATKPILGDYNQLPRPISYPVLPGDRVLIQLMTGFTYHVTGGTTDGTVDIEVLTPEAIDFSIGVQ